MTVMFMPTKDGDNIEFVNIRYMDDSGPTKVLRKKYWNEYDWLHPFKKKRNTIKIKIVSHDNKKKKEENIVQVMVNGGEDAAK